MSGRIVFFTQLLPVLFHILGQSASTTWAFTTSPTTTTTRTPTVSTAGSAFVLHAGGFEWEDPTDEKFDQGVDNPFKNPELMKSINDKEGDGEDGAKSKIDPARLLGPRLQGSNLYLIGMMGSGKSSVGDKLARRKLKLFALYKYYPRTWWYMIPHNLFVRSVCSIARSLVVPNDSRLRLLSLYNCHSGQCRVFSVEYNIYLRMNYYIVL